MARLHPVGNFFIAIFAGLFVSYLESVLFTQGIIIDEFLSGTSITLGELMFFTMFMFLIIGMFAMFLDQ